VNRQNGAKLIVVSNFPFQDRKNRGKTQHKLWITFTKKMYDMINESDAMLLISPQSWGSPSNKVLNIFKDGNVKYVNFDSGKYFPHVGSSFSDYLIVKDSGDKKPTKLYINEQDSYFTFSDNLLYIPNDICAMSMSIHDKVIFSQEKKLCVEHDYVTCHNILLKEDNPTLSKEKTCDHVHPVFHTNRQTWFSSKEQDFRNSKKVMWTRSGYTIPFYDAGKLGCTDLGYFVRVDSKEQGLRLEANLNNPLFKYILTTAKWSGFGNEKVFNALPDVADIHAKVDEDIYDYFNLTDEEVDYITNFKPAKKSKNAPVELEIRTQERSDNHGEVFTPAACVSEMLDRKEFPQEFWSDISTMYLDPACGNGNFLVEVLRRKIANGATPTQALSTTYGIDIMMDNVAECRQRLFKIAYEANGNKFDRAWKDILTTNIAVGDALRFDTDDIFGVTPTSEELKEFREMKKIEYLNSL